MKLSGELVVNKPIGSVRELLLSPDRVARCLPYLVSWERRGNGFTASFRVDVGGVVDYLSRLVARASIEVEEVGENDIDYVFEGTVARARYSGVIHLHLEEAGAGTRIRWSADVELGKALQLLSRFIAVDVLVDRIVGEVADAIIKCAGKENA